MALSYVAVLLCSPSSPCVRTAVAESLSVAILTFSEHIFPPVGDHANDDAEGVNSPCDESLAVLSETDWSRPVAELKPIRDHLCTLFGIKGPSSSSS